MSVHVSVDRSSGKPVLLFTTRLDHSPARVWQALTDPGEMRGWYPCRVELEGRVGGRIVFLWDDEEPDESIITEFDAPRVLAYEWAGERLRWTIEADGEGSILRLSNTILDPDWMPRTAAGWDTCLTSLSAMLSGTVISDHRGPDTEKIERYRSQFAL